MSSNRVSGKGDPDPRVERGMGGALGATTATLVTDMIVYGERREI